jgi:hypothetical protein
MRRPRASLEVRAHVALGRQRRACPLPSCRYPLDVQSSPKQAWQVPGSPRLWPWGRERVRPCAHCQTQRTRLMSVSTDGPLDKYASASTALLSAGRSGILPRYLNTTPDTSTWSCRFSPTPGRFSTTNDRRDRRHVAGADGRPVASIQSRQQRFDSPHHRRDRHRERTRCATYPTVRSRCSTTGPAPAPR